MPGTVLATADAVAERGKLRRELGRLDAVCLLITAVVVMDTVRPNLSIFD